MLCGSCSGKIGGNIPKKPAKSKYACDVCGRTVQKWQAACKCGEWLNWNKITVIENGKIVTQFG